MGSRATTHLKDLCLVYSLYTVIHMGCYSYMNAIIIVDFCTSLKLEGCIAAVIYCIVCVCQIGSHLCSTCIIVFLCRHANFLVNMQISVVNMQISVGNMHVSVVNMHVSVVKMYVSVMNM